jgi:glucokinase
MPATELDEPCPCGSSGHLEAIAGGYAIGRIGTREGETGRSGALAAALRANAGRPLSAADVAAVAAAGDPVARAIVERARAAVAAAVVGYVNAFNPSLLVVGGAIARAGGAAYVEALRTAIDAHAFPTAARRVKVLPAALGDDAGLIGAAVIAAEFLP